jgi:CubicO group peptidase (beta-lactamase class C family)
VNSVGRAILAVALVVAVRASVAAQALSAADVAKIDAVVRNDMRAAATPGVSLAIVRGTQIVYAKGYGFKNLTTRAPVDPQSIFRYGSVTKEFTAAEMVLLQRDGKLSLSDPISRWFPAATDASDVRIVDLLNMASGYRDYYPLDYVDLEMARPASMAAIAREYEAFPLTAPPRRRYEYSNTNYLFAGLIAERVTGRSIADLLRDRLLVPAGMTHAFYDEPQRAVADRATGYNSYFTEPPHEDALEAPNWLNAAGALAGTATDLARWDIALMRNAILSRAEFETMATNRILMPGNRDTRYGLGLAVETRNGHRVVSHGGNVIGFAASNALAPDDGVAVVVLTNSYEAPADQFCSDVLDIALPVLARRTAASQPAPKPSTPPPLTPPQQRAMALMSTGLAALRTGVLPASLITPDFAALMNSTNRSRAMTTLARLGPTQRLDFLGRDPRGGLYVTVASARFRSGNRTAVLYATPDGRIAELFLFP